MSSKVTSSGLRKTKSIHVTREQKSILKNAFMFIPYPDHYPDSLSKLSDDTGLDQEAIKKWFRNRRKKVGSKNGDNENPDEIEIQNDEVDKSLNTDEASVNVVQNPNANEAEAVNEDMPSENVQVSNDVVNEELASENVQVSNNEELASENVQVSNDDVANVQLATDDVKSSNDAIESVVTPDETEEHSPNMEVSSEPPIDKTIELNDTVEETKDDKSSVDSSVIIVNRPELAVEAQVEETVHEATYDVLNPDPAVEIVVPKQEETKSVDGQEELSKEEKAVQYDVLKSEFSALQNKFESLAKVLGSHGIDVGDESATAQPTTSQLPTPDDIQPETPSYTYSQASGPVQQKVVYPPGPPAEESKKPEEFVAPKQEPQPYGWPNQDYNSQMYNQPWLQYPHQQYPPLYPNGYSTPYPPQNYNLPYPPPQYPFHNQSLVQNPSVQDSPLSSPANEASYPTQPTQPDATPKLKTKATKKRTTPKNQSRVTPYPRGGLPNIQNSVDKIGAQPVQSFQGVIGAAKKSFQGPSKLKSKSNPKVPDFNSVQPPSTLPGPPSAVPGPAIRSLPVQPGGKKPRRKALPLKSKAPDVQTLYPPLLVIPGTSTQSMPPLPGNKPRRNTLQPKTKLGAHPKPFPKVAPAPVSQVQAYEQSLKASNPFRQTKPKAPVSRRNSMPAKILREPEIQTLYPPIIHESQPARHPGIMRPDVEFLRGVNQKTIQKTQDVQRSLQMMGGVSLKKVPGPSFPMINNTSISIKKVYNPLTDPNKAQELKKVMAMKNLSVSLSRK